MLNTHVCHVDCNLIEYPTGAKAHMMYAAEPSSAAGRYQWEQNAAIKLQGRRAWRATGQGQSRECRVWDERRRAHRKSYRFATAMHHIRASHRALNAPIQV